jgi:MFS family permease
VAVGSEMPTASREPASSRWGPFARIAFTTIWVGNIVYNTGNAMWDAGSPVLMASLNASPLILSLIQVAISLPIFLLTLPAGAITDIVDLRRLLIAVESISAAVAAVFAFLVALKVATPFSLLISTFLLGVCGALAAPGWVAIVPLLVPPRELEGAIAANTVGYNMTRAIGPMFGGLVIAEYGIAAPFWSCSASHLAIIAALIFWRGRGRCADPNPRQDLRSAFGDGLRHAANNRGLRATLVRAVAFCLFASAYWALLPVVAEKQMGAAPELYGFLLGAIGVGAIAGSFVLGWFRARLGPDRVVDIGTLGTALALFLFAAARDPATALSACLIGGACWTVNLTTLFVSAQVALPDWVRGRGLAMLLTAIFGAMTVGSLAWGQAAESAGESEAFVVAGLCAVLVIPLASRWKLLTVT